MNDWLEVHALLDDELSPEERLEVQERMKTCKVRQTEWAFAREIKLLLSNKCTQPECEDLWKQCANRLQQIDRAKRAEFFIGRYAWAICGVFFLAILGAAGLNRFNGSGLHASDVATASFGPFSTPKSQAPNDIGRWLQDKLNENAVPAQPNRIFFIDGAAGQLRDGRRVSKAELRDAQGQLNFFMVEKADKVDDVHQVDGHGQYSGGSIDGQNCITWTDRGNAYVLVGNRPVEKLCEVADALYSKQ